MKEHRTETITPAQFTADMLSTAAQAAVVRYNDKLADALACANLEIERLKLKANRVEQVEEELVRVKAENRRLKRQIEIMEQGAAMRLTETPF